MKILKQLLTKPLDKVSKGVAIFIIVVALAGFVDATYLTIEHYRGVVPPCTVGGGCENVLTSEYSSVFGLPVALGGSIYYFFVLIGAFGYLESGNEKLIRAALLLTFVGFIASCWFIYTQVFLIHSHCDYCLGSAISSTILFVTALEIFSRNH